MRKRTAERRSSPHPQDLLAKLDSSDFQGRTAFRRLSPDEKLLWVAHAASFALEARRIRQKSKEK